MDARILLALGATLCMGQRLSRRRSNPSVWEARMAQIREESGRQRLIGEVTEARWNQYCRECRERDAAKARGTNDERPKEMPKSTAVN